MTADTPQTTLRPARPEDAPAIAGIWWHGWRDGHLGFIPDELLAARTEQSFSTRAGERIADTTVAVTDGSVAGFVMVVADEVEQVYVSSDHRGSGIAATLLVTAERLVAQNGHATAWLAVVAGNARARRFYERRGWSDAGAFTYAAAGANDPIDVPCQRYEKDVTEA